MLRLFIGVLFACLAWSQARWEVLFDGKSLAGWKAQIIAELVGTSWEVADGAMRPLPVARKTDLWSTSTYRNFALEFEFRVAPHANGGIKYLIQDTMALRRRGSRFLPVESTLEEPGDGYLEGASGLEFQIVDDDDDEAKDPKRRTGAIYGLIPPTNPPAIRPGAFHQGRIVVNGDKVEHYLDGTRVVSVTLGSPAMEAAWEAIKIPYLLRLRPLKLRDTPIAITHHDTSVQYRNIRIQRLP